MHVRAGVRAILSQPALVLGEIAWRWAFGAAAWTLLILAIHRILGRVDVTQAELLIARHGDLFLIADACARILCQVLPQLARECAVLAPAIAVLWVAAATVGRAITLQALLSTQAPPSTPGAGIPFGQLAVLNSLRAVLALATLLAFLGTMLFAGMMMAGQNLTSAAAISIVLAAVVAFLWSVLNWFLALAPIWIVRDGRPALRSIADSVNLYRGNPARYAGIAGWFGLWRGVGFVAAFVAALIAAQASPASAIALCVVISLVYFALADFLSIARLAAFVALEESGQFAAAGSQPVSPAPEPLASPEA